MPARRHGKKHTYRGYYQDHDRRATYHARYPPENARPSASAGPANARAPSFLPDPTTNWAFLPPELSARVEQAMSSGYSNGTLIHYMSARNIFLDFCDRHGVPAHLRFPADETILCAFAASMATQYSGSYVSNIISGVKSWHVIHDVPWHGSGRLYIIIRGVHVLAPPESKQKPRTAVTTAMLSILARELDPHDGQDCAILAAALVAFWAQCRLGELLGTSRLRHSPLTLPSRSSLTAAFTAAGSCELHLPSTKTHRAQGESVTILRQYGDLDPIRALCNHLSVNAAVPEDHHLFASASIEREGLRIRNLTKEVFLARVNEIWSKHGFKDFTGHCFRIGGTTELLLRGMPPDLVRKMGRWCSDAHLRYWRETKHIAADHAELLPIGRPPPPHGYAPPLRHSAHGLWPRTF